MKVTWKELKISPEDEKTIAEIRNNSSGKSLSPELMEKYHVGEEQEFTIETRVGDCRVYLYRPVGTSESNPLLINLHGGGFVKGRRDQDTVFCRNICSRSGWTVLDVDYIPSPVMRYPGQVYTSYDVLQYCASHSRELLVDRNRIVMCGHSVGGTLTAAAILMAIDEGTFIPAMQILDYAALDLKTPALERRNGNSNPRIPAWKSDFYHKMYVEPEQTKEVYCSPCFASDEQLEKMPPVMMIYCDNDMFCDEDEIFLCRLLKLGIPVRAKRFFHSDHGFVVQRRGEYELAERMILDALENISK